MGKKYKEENLKVLCMKTALVFPRHPSWKEKRSFKPFEGGEGYKVAPLGIAYLASYLREYSDVKVDIDLIDANARGLSVEETSILLLKRKYDLIGISFMTIQADFAYELSKNIRENLPGDVCTIVHGGVHSTARPRESLNNFADYCVLGEGEETFLELLESLNTNSEVENIEGIAYIKSGKVVVNNPREPIENLDTIPYPAWDLLPVDRYNEIYHHFGKALPVMTSRGCPFACYYCSSPFFWKRRVRQRSCENVIGEIERNINEFNINKYHFYDDDLLLNTNFVKELCNRIIEKEMHIKWVCLSRPRSVARDPDVVGLLRKAGCCLIEIGAESGDQKVLDAINKKQNLNDIKTAIKILKKHGFDVSDSLLLMTFNMGESINGHYMQSKFLSEVLGRKSCVCVGSFSTPYPGTVFERIAKDKGMVFFKNWKDRVTYEINFIPNSLLDDIPLKTSDGLGATELRVLKALNSVGIGLDPEPKETLENKLKRFYEYCDGKRSVKQISKRLAKEYLMHFEYSIKWVALQTIFCAQLGLIKS